MTGSGEHALLHGSSSVAETGLDGSKEGVVHLCGEATGVTAML